MRLIGAYLLGPNIKKVTVLVKVRLLFSMIGSESTLVRGSHDIHRTGSFTPLVKDLLVVLKKYTSLLSITNENLSNLNKYLKEDM